MQDGGKQSKQSGGLETAATCWQSPLVTPLWIHARGGCQLSVDRPLSSARGK